MLIKVKSFWRDEFEPVDDHTKRIWIEPVRNKLSKLTGNVVLRNILGQQVSTISISAIMDKGAVCLIDLGRGTLDPGTAALFGSVYVARMVATSMARAKVAKNRRRRHFLFIDEAQTLEQASGGIYAEMLAELRKFMVSAILGYQYTRALNESAREALFGTVGNLCALRPGPRDIGFLSEILQPEFPPARLLELDRYEMAVKILDQGDSRQPFVGTTYFYDDAGKRLADPLRPYWVGERLKVRRLSRRVHGGRREVIERKHVQWFQRRTAERRLEEMTTKQAKLRRRSRPRI